MKFSVITINYNHKDGLRSTIESVVRLRHIDYEFIIIDGGSTDGSVDIIKQYAANITYWVSEKDKGVYHAMNKGVAMSKGEYLIFMNSGDCFHSPDALNAVEHYQEDIVYSAAGCRLTNDDGTGTCLRNGDRQRRPHYDGQRCGARCQQPYRFCHTGRLRRKLLHADQEHEE